MTARELRATASLAVIFATRLIGLFMIYPVFAAYARGLPGGTPPMIGMTLGAYGLTQGTLQIPMGLLSDRIGRKAVISSGLALFGVGSVVAALATSVDGVLLGRILQGCGAVGSAILAMVADLTREEVRTKAMAMIGASIGLAFVLAIVAGPIVEGAIGVPGIFWLTAALAVIGIGIVQLAVPTPVEIQRHRDATAIARVLSRVLRDSELIRLDFGIFALHAVLTASFLAVPQLLAGTLHVAGGDAWKVYLPVLAVSVALMMPAIMLGEKGKRTKEVLLGAVALLAASLLAPAVAGGVIVPLLAGLIAFFTAFNVMEAMLPSLVTKTAPAEAKGTATGVYSSAQFLGIFVGGAGGGSALALGGITGVLAFGLGVALVWLVAVWTMRHPPRFASYLVRCGRMAPGEAGTLAARLKGAAGVVDAVVVEDEGVAYLKIDPAHFDAAAVGRLVGQ